MFDPNVSRVTRSLEQVRQSYTRMSRWYDLFSGTERQFTEIGLNLLDIKPDERILEVGFGTGQALVDIARYGAHGFGVDVSEGMLAVAQKRIVSAGMEHHVELSLEDARHLSFKNNFFNAVFMSFTLELFDTPEIPIVLEECRRVLCKNGRLGIVALNKKPTAICRVYEWGHGNFQAFFDCRPIFVRDCVEAADFRVESCQEKSLWGLPIAIVLGCKPG